MLKSLNRIILFLVFFAAWLLFPDCAQIGGLTGGDKDSIPPAVIESRPELYAVNVEADRIEFTFDEFFVLDAMRSKFYSSPPLEEYPDFKIKGKSLQIKFKEELKDSVTYYLHFGSGVKDYTEGNFLNKFSYVFSTGTHIDSMRIAGQLLRADNLKPEIAAGVMLYSTFADSVPSLERPFYYALTDSNGRFSFNYIRPGRYKIFSLQDNDANMLFNLPNERIAFLDSLIVPSLRIENQTDTLKAGSITSKGDTLLSDSIWTTSRRYYSPDSLVLLSFEEDHKSQYIKDFVRPLPGKLELYYKLPAENVSVWFPFRHVARKDTLVQFSDSADVQTIWLKDSLLYQTDSLYLHVRYPMPDSSGNIFPHTDSLLFLNLKVVKDSSIFTKFSYVLSEQIGDFEQPKLHFEAPLKSSDSTKLRLVQLIDTMVNDERKQLLVHYQRPEANRLIFKFKRPVQEFVPNFADEVNYRIEQNAASDSFWCILPDETATEDTIDVEIHFDNEYFFDQTQSFSKALSISYTQQAVRSAQRTAPDIYRIEFEKEPAAFALLDVNSEEQIEYTIDSIRHKRFYYLKFTNSQQAANDTLILQIDSEDGPFPDGSVKPFSKKLQAVYRLKKQYITHAERVSRQGFFLLFNRPVEIEDAEVYDYREKPVQAILAERDSLYFDDIRWKAFDTLKIAVHYRDEYQKERIDSFALRVEPKKKTVRRRAEFNQSTDPGLKKITAEKEIPFQIIPDSADYLSYFVSADYQADSKYRFESDSAAFTDIFGRTVMPLKSDFEVKGEDYYGSLELKLINVAYIADENFYKSKKIDTFQRSSLDDGQLLLYLFGEDEQIHARIKTKQDTIIKIDKLLPQAYFLKVVYDQNSDNTWNTGNYYDNRQAERVIFLPKQINIKSGWSFKYDWYINFTGKRQ